MIVCLLCNKKLKSLLTHVFYAHGLSVDEFKKLYPGHRLHTETKDKTPKECLYCNDGKLYVEPGLSVHIAYKHKNVKYRDPKNKDKHQTAPKAGFICPICNKLKKNFSQHIELYHKIAWDEFVVKYNWTKGKSYFSKEHKENLSVNKKKFYNETTAGAELKKAQSIKNSGENNPARREDVRRKISKKAIERLQAQSYSLDDAFVHKQGINVEYKGIIYKSLSEFQAVLCFEKYNFMFSYEDKVITYTDVDSKVRSYLVDFVVGKYVIEMKPEYQADDYKDEFKYKSAEKLLQKEGFTYYVCDPTCLHTVFDKPRILPFEFKNICKDLLKNNKVKFFKKSKIHNYSFFKELDSEYKNNPNFICK